MNKLIITILFLSATFVPFHDVVGQDLVFCEPLGETTCDNPYWLCEDTQIDFCQCPLTLLNPEFGYFAANLSFEFYSDGSSNAIDIILGGDDWLSTSVVIIGPLSEASTCEEPVPATTDQDLFVSESMQDGSLNGVALSSIPGAYKIIFLGIGTHGSGDLCPFLNINFEESLECYDEPCETCIGSFAPIPESQLSSGKYLIGAWAKEANASPNKTTYDNPELSVVFSNGITTTAFGPFSPQGAIIDGWQRIEEEIAVPSDAISIQVVLSSSNGDVYFDDIRFFPFDASMKSYVYDPINMRLAAELDERHYATFYEYDEEGKLVRIKKETEKGVMTIQETKSNSSK